MLKKGHSWLRFLIQVALIVFSIAVLIVFYLHIENAADKSLNNTYAAISFALVFICFLLNFAIQIYCSKRDSSPARDLRDEDLIKLKTKAQTDSLTGLLNREESIEQITHFLTSEGHDHCHTLLIIDLDNFKSINDTFGHFEGDKVIKIIAGKIRSVFRNIDIVGRLGGDEFIVLMKHTSTKSIVRRKALELMSALEYMASSGNVAVTVTGSIGISTYDGDGKTFEVLYKEADEALYRAKLGGKNRYSYFKETEIEEPREAAEGSRETALTESGAFVQLQALIDNIDGGIALLEIAGEIRSIFLSQSYVKLMHLSYSEIKDAHNKVFDFIHRDDISQLEETLRQGAASSKPVEAVFRRLTESGDTKWYHMRAVRIQYEDSDLPVLIAIVTDVTNLKMTELNFQAQKKQLETVLKISHVVTFEVDIARRTLHVTDPTVTKYGIDVHEIGDMPESLIEAGVIHPDSVDECRRMYNEIYAGVKEGSAIIRTLKRDGQFTIERFTYFTVYDESGQPVKAVGVDEGMETRSASNLRVDLIERQFKNNPEGMRTIVKVVVTDNSFEYLKPEDIPDEERAKITSYSELLEYRIKQIADPADRVIVWNKFGIESLRKELPDGKQISHEYRVIERDGSIGWNNMSVGLYLDQFDGKVYAFIRTRDISFRKNLEQALGEKVSRDANTFMYTFDVFGKMAEVLLKVRKRKCAVTLISIANYNELLEQYGRIMMGEILIGFMGKVMTAVSADHVSCYLPPDTIALLVEAESEEPLGQMTEKILKILRNPAYFQFHEEVFMEFACGISISDDGTPGFHELYEEAFAALCSLRGRNDSQVAFFQKI